MEKIVANKEKLLSKQYASFLGYCRQQSAKYGIKGSRVHAAKKFHGFFEDVLSKPGIYSHTKLGELSEELDQLTTETEHTSIIDIPVSDGKVIVRHLEVCNKKMPFTDTVKNAHEILGRIVAEYGKRALQAETNDNVDWKALSHAARIGYESIELLTTGFVTFPRPEREHLLAIKTGKLTYKEVSPEIENLLTEIERYASISTLRDKPDQQWIDNFIAEEYGFRVWQWGKGLFY